MADSVKKSQGKNRNSSSKGATAKKTPAKSTATKVPKAKSPAAEKPPLESTNMNGRRKRSPENTESRSMGELEKRGYVSRRIPDAEERRKAAAKRDDIIIIIVTLICILMVLSYAGICGVVGTGINAFVFGLFGRLGYILPFIIWILTIFMIANRENGVSPLGVVYAVLLSGVLGALIQLAVGGFDENIGFFEYFSNSSLNYEGESATYGGLLGGCFVKLLCPLVGKAATVLILIALLLILFVLMTGKPFVAAVIRKFNRRLADFRRRRAIEKNEKEYYEDLEDDAERKPVPRVRYGVRRLPERRMGTMNVTFGKREERSKNNTVVNEEKPKTKQKPDAAPVKTQAQAVPEKNNDETPERNLYIPGVGNVRLGKDSSYGIKEEEYTEKDFAEVSELASDENVDGRKKETTRKLNMFEEDGRITSVGVKTLHSGSINRTSDNNITNITDIHSKPRKDEGYSDERDIAIHVKEVLQDAEHDGYEGFEEESPDLVPIDEVEQDEPSGGAQVIQLHRVERKNHETPVDDDGPDSFEDDTQENTEPETTEPENVYDDATEETPVQVKKKNTDTEADTEPQKVTKVGSGAAVFTDMSKEPEKPKMPEYIFPPVSYLSKSKSLQGKNYSKKEELESTIQKLQNTFESFGVSVKVTDASVGPTVTRYELLPNQGVKVKTITALSDDIKLALAAAEIRIEAPIPGKAAVGIEVPNRESSPVLFGDLIDSDEFRNCKTNLAFAVGKDIAGKNIISNIGGMPHALIAGATGSGKSVCINALIMSILYKAKPTDVKMIMIDPKRVELVGYNGIPHLIVPVVTDVKKAAGALAWAVAEMDDRYKRFADAGVRDLAAYNSLMEERFMEEGGDGECTDKLPQIVIIVDELNDLMMTANSKEVEADIARLTQLARACGIHVILATQRPSVNVITGTIKANIPTRIAFSVSSIVDSRTILDQAGAEKLLGKGDMLFYPQGYPKPVRLQGAYISDAEVNKVVDFIKKQYKEMRYNDLVSKHIDEKSAGKTQAKEEVSQQNEDADDEFFEEAARLIIKKQKASVGMLQREFRIGFNRAARIMDRLADEGVVGPEDSTKPRKILMTMEEFEAFMEGRQS